MYYLRARYYDPEISRFISEDPHWNIGNMIYGDEPQIYIIESSIYSSNDMVRDHNMQIYHKAYIPNKYNQYTEKTYNEISVPDSSAIIQANNMYSYCLNNPINYYDYSGEEVRGIGVTFNVAFMIKGTGQLMYVKDDKGNQGIIVVRSIGGGTPNAGISVGGIVHSADTIFDLEGMSISAGGSFGPIGGDFDTSIGGGLSAGISVLPAELHFDISFGEILWSKRK